MKSILNLNLICQVIHLVSAKSRLSQIKVPHVALGLRLLCVCFTRIFHPLQTLSLTYLHSQQHQSIPQSTFSSSTPHLLPSNQPLLLYEAPVSQHHLSDHQQQLQWLSSFHHLSYGPVKPKLA